MRIIIAPDSFKGSLKSPAVAEAIAAGVRDAAPDAEILQLPVGDGGEGTLDALVAATGGTFELHTVHGPLGEPVQARLGLLGDGQTVFVEMAEASGLSLLRREQRDPLRASTYGTGELIRAALATGRPRMLVGIGGSATNDGGAGALQALGARLLDAAGRELPLGGAALDQLAEIDLSRFQLPREVEVVIACDVTNPLTGPDGASAIYGPQKGATPDDVRLLDAALARLAEVSARKLGKDWVEAPGAGAAGGLGFALLAFCGGRMERGVRLVLETVRFREQIRGADLIFTGEGKIDRQTTAFGKTITGVGELARLEGVPVVALAGGLDTDCGDYRAAGIASVMSIIPRPMSLDEAISAAPALIRDTARRVVELWVIPGKIKTNG